jgi:hypothetical protein
VQVSVAAIVLEGGVGREVFSQRDHFVTVLRAVPERSHGDRGNDGAGEAHRWRSAGSPNDGHPRLTPPLESCIF